MCSDPPAVSLHLSRLISCARVTSSLDQFPLRAIAELLLHPSVSDTARREGARFVEYGSGAGRLVLGVAAMQVRSPTHLLQPEQPSLQSLCSLTADASLSLRRPLSPTHFCWPGRYQSASACYLSFTRTSAHPLQFATRLAYRSPCSPLALIFSLSAELGQCRRRGGGGGTAQHCGPLDQGR